MARSYPTHGFSQGLDQSEPLALQQNQQQQTELEQQQQQQQHDSPASPSLDMAMADVDVFYNMMLNSPVDMQQLEGNHVKPQDDASMGFSHSTGMFGHALNLSNTSGFEHSYLFSMSSPNAGFGQSVMEMSSVDGTFPSLPPASNDNNTMAFSNFNFEDSTNPDNLPQAGQSEQFNPMSLPSMPPPFVTSGAVAIQQEQQPTQQLPQQLPPQPQQKQQQQQQPLYFEPPSALSSTPIPTLPTKTKPQNPPVAAASQSRVSGAPAAVVSGPRPPPRNMYSRSGVNVVRMLSLVEARKNPTVNVGPVDMSCAFVVCDILLNDCPIIYASENFQNLSGYSLHEILGKNCRFLQAPDGNMKMGAKREFVDDSVMYDLKQKVAASQEAQLSLINYRKGGKSFYNFLTVIPIPWDTDEMRYYVGFQIDVLESPGGATAAVDYARTPIDSYIWTPPPASHCEPGRTLTVDDVSTLLQQFNTGGPVSDWHRISWDKMLLENADDVVHVMSLKGVFLFLSPSCKKVLEYDPKELIGSSLSAVCHPTDIVPVLRELKDAGPEPPVNVVFRIRRKLSGYTWFESHGCLCTEHGKGRKYIILIGRMRSVFKLPRAHLSLNGGAVGSHEFWSKLSASGMFLYVTSNVRRLLDLQPDQLFGTSFQQLMGPESRGDFGRAVERARQGSFADCKHEVINQGGQVKQAHTFFYSGDASDGHGPSFLLAQTKLLKSSTKKDAQLTDEARTELGGAGDHDDALSVSSQSDIEDSVAAHVSTDVLQRPDVDVFEELKTTRCSSWQFELRQMERMNRVLAEELAMLLSHRKKRKRLKCSGSETQ